MSIMTNKWETFSKNTVSFWRYFIASENGFEFLSKKINVTNRCFKYGNGSWKDIYNISSGKETEVGKYLASVFFIHSSSWLDEENYDQFKKEIDLIHNTLDGISIRTHVLDKILDLQLFFRKRVISLFWSVIEPSETLKGLMKKDFYFSNYKNAWKMEFPGKEWNWPSLDDNTKYSKGLDDDINHSKDLDNDVESFIFENGFHPTMVYCCSSNSELFTTQKEAILCLKRKVEDNYKKRIPKIFWSQFMLFMLMIHGNKNIDIDFCVRFLENLDVKALLKTAKRILRQKPVYPLACFVVYIFGKHSVNIINQLDINDDTRHQVENVMKGCFEKDGKDLDIHRALFLKFGNKYNFKVMATIGQNGFLHKKFTVDEISSFDNLENFISENFNRTSTFEELCNEFNLEYRGKEILEMKERGDLGFSGLMEFISKVKVTYGNYTCEILDKNDVLGFKLGTLTHCCQVPGGVGESCVYFGYVKSCSGFIVFKNGDNLIAQGWVYAIDDEKTFVIDSIENVNFNKNGNSHILTVLLSLFSEEIKKLGINHVHLGLGYNKNNFKGPITRKKKDFVYPKSFGCSQIYSDANESRMLIMLNNEVRLKKVKPIVSV